jgi:pyruvate dehydrogenase E2 component (dihydrolipoamide acetyltransferase)
MSVLIDVGMPRLSDSMEEATVLSWLKRPGDVVARGEPLVEVETDKATMVYEAEDAGVLEEIVVDDGGTAALGDVIARLRVADEAGVRGSPAPTASPRAETAVAAVADLPATSQPARSRPGRARATPVARRLAGELGVALEDLGGSGPGGRIVRADVRSAAANGGAAQAAGGGRGELVEVELTATQRTIARRMSESRSTIPEFTLEVEVDMTSAVQLRADLRSAGHEPPPSYNDVVVRAAALALRDVPALNAGFDAGRVLRYGRVNVGVAVATDDALIVPTIFDADRLPLVELAAEARRLAAGARDRSLQPAELADGTFTVSNLGMFGVRRFHAVINVPQAAILAVGEVAERPVVAADGSLVARTTMEITLSCDHRVVYGAEAGRFLQRLRELLEHHPTRLVVG